MKKVTLGNTGIEVTELCFGALPIGPNQKNIPVAEAAEVIALALEKGVTFIDTAQGYRTYPHIKAAMDKTGITPVISTKSPATTYEDMEKAVNEALTSLGLKRIDIFLLHAARAGVDVFEKRSGALRCLLDYKERGLIRAVGLSTHDAQVAMLSAHTKEIDVVFPIINNIGMGILNGTREDMENAIKECYANQKAVFLMKALAGGNLLNDYKTAMDYARGIADGHAAIAVGMVTKKEVEMNLKYFNDADISEDIANMGNNSKSFTVIRGICLGCKKCMDVCHSSAISMADDGKPLINNEKCLKCGYCVEACKNFSIRMI